jgi:hypothetical protein
MVLDECPGGTPANSALWNKISRTEMDTSTVRSLMCSMMQLHFQRGSVPPSGIPATHWVSLQPGYGFIQPIVDVPLMAYSGECGPDAPHDWGTFNDGAKRLAYDICRLMLGREEWAKKVWKAFLYENVMLWPPDDFNLSLADVHWMVERSARRL